MKYADYKKEDVPAVKYPVNTVQYNEIREASEDGIFKVGKDKYSKSWEFSDNNYPIQSEEEQELTLMGLARLYVSMGCDLELTLASILDADAEKKEKAVKFPEKGDGHDELRRELNQLISRRMLISSKTVVKKVLTATIKASNMDNARNKFISREMNLTSGMAKIASPMKAMKLNDRMNLICSIQNPGVPLQEFTEWSKKNIRETLALNQFGYDRDLIKTSGKTGKWFTKLFYIRDFGDLIDDDFFLQLLDLKFPLCISMHIRPVENEETNEILLKRLDKVNNDINKEQDRNNKLGHYHSQISYNRDTERKQLKKMLDDLKYNNEKLFVASFTLALWGSSREEIEELEESIYDICREKSVNLAQHEVKLREAYMTALPLGLRMTRTLRPMFSQSLSGLNPFGAKDMESGESKEELYYGVNYVTKKLLWMDRKRMKKASHGLLVGQSGSGKSLFNKMEKIQVYLKTDDDIIIIDPMNEYADLADGTDGVFYACDANAPMRFNPLAPPNTQIINKDFITKKSLLMNAIIAIIMREDFRSAHQDILEIAVKRLYQTAGPYNMSALRQILQKMDDLPLAADLALAMNRLCEGTLNIFDDRTSNIDYKRVTIFGLGAKDTAIADERTTITMIVLMDYITNRVAENRAIQRTTWVDVDEAQKVISLEHAAKVFDDFWQTMRKLRGICTAITPNIRNLRKTQVGQSIISNTPYKVAFYLEKDDRADAKEHFGLKDVQMEYIRNAGPGSAVIKIDNMFYQMESGFEEDEKQSRLYRMITTNPYED